MNKLKEDLFKDLEELTPKISDSLRDYPITVKEKKSIFSSWQFKILTPAISFILLGVIMLSIFLKPTTPDDPIIKNQVYLIEVNPAFLLVTDENSNLVQLKSGNSDADEVLLSINTDELIGKKVDTAIETLADELLQLGYFNNSEDSVMKVSSDNGDEKVVNKFNEYFCQKGYYVAVLEEKINYEEFNSKFNCAVKDTKTLLSQIEKMKELQIDNNDFENINIEDEYIRNYLKTEITNILLESKIFTQEQIDEYLSMLDEYVTAENLEETINTAIQFIKLMSPETAEKLEKYTSIPKTKEEFVEKVKEIYKSKAEEKKNNNKEKYEEVKESISLEEHDNFIDSIKNQYGDIKDFWENKQNNNNNNNPSNKPKPNN